MKQLCKPARRKAVVGMCRCLASARAWRWSTPPFHWFRWHRTQRGRVRRRPGRKSALTPDLVGKCWIGSPGGLLTPSKQLLTGSTNHGAGLFFRRHNYRSGRSLQAFTWRPGGLRWGGFASHANSPWSPNLLSLLPAEVDFESAAFATLGLLPCTVSAGPGAAWRTRRHHRTGAAGLLPPASPGRRLRGVRIRPRPTPGRPAQIDGDGRSRRESAESMGASFTHGRGFDAVLITADSRSDDPVILAGRWPAIAPALSLWVRWR